MTRSTRSPGHGLRSLDRGLQILAYVQERGQATTAEVAADLDLPLSTTYRYVKALVRSGFLVEFDGLMVASQRLADRIGDRDAQLRAIAAPVLDALAARTAMAACLTVRMHLASLCLAVRRVAYSVTSHREGRALALYAGASATPLLAYAPPDVRERVLTGHVTAFTARTPDRTTLRREVERIPAAGFHLTRGWITHGMTGVGVPVLLDGACVCALSVIAPDSQIPDPPTATVTALRAAADDLTLRLTRARTGPA